MDWIITAPELKSILSQDPSKIVLVDVREPEEFEVSSIPGCILIPLGELQLRAPQELNSEDDLVIYCAHGIRSLHAVAALRQMGYSKTRSLEGGIAEFETSSFR